MTDIHKVTVNIDGRNVEMLVKPGVVSSIEIGRSDGIRDLPTNRIVVVSGDGPTAWIQISRFEENGSINVASEMWISEEMSNYEASISVEISASDEIKANLERLSFGRLCCISYGSNCYVRCCNCCCSDPVGCPGASCCS